MPVISPDLGYWTVLNVFRTDSPENQQRLLGEMRKIVDTAAFEGWISSTVHSGVDKIGTANFIQWREKGDLERRYAGDAFKHQIPLFVELTTETWLLQTEVAFSQRTAGAADPIEISPARDDYTVIEILSVQPENLAELTDTLGKTQQWLLDVPGYRSHVVLQGKALRDRYAVPREGAFVVSYAQWDSKEAYDAYRTRPQSEWPADRLGTQLTVDRVVTGVEWNTYRVHHTRSAATA
jgi:heme-degrading monooxygenase HmoA